MQKLFLQPLQGSLPQEFTMTTTSRLPETMALKTCSELGGEDDVPRLSMEGQGRPLSAIATLSGILNLAIGTKEQESARTQENANRQEGANIMLKRGLGPS